MAGTPSVAPSKPHGSCGALRRPQRLRGLPWKDQGEGRPQLSLLPPHGAQRWTQLALVKYSPQLEEAFHRRKRPVWISWRMDETIFAGKGSGTTSIAPWISMDRRLTC